MLQKILSFSFVTILLGASAAVAQTRPASEPEVVHVRADTSQTDAGGEDEWLKKRIDSALHGDVEIQNLALDDIANSGKYSLAAAAAVRKLLDSEHVSVSRRAQRALVAMGSGAAPQWLDAVRSKHSFARSCALLAFGDPQLRLDGDDLIATRVAIEKCLNDEVFGNRLKAVHALARFWPDSAPALIVAIKGGDRDIFAEVHSLIVDEKPPLLTETRPEDVQTGQRLFMHKADPKVLIELVNLFADDLLEMMRLPDGETRRHAFAAINALPPECAADRLAANYEGQMRGDDEKLRRDAAYSLGLMGPVATPRLIIGSDSDDEFVRGFCISALCNRTDATSDHGQINVICAAMIFESDNIRRTTLKWANGLSQPPPKAFISLAWGLTTDGPHGFREIDERVAAVTALGKGTNERKACVAVLTHVLEDDSEPPRIAALEALRGFGADAGPALAQIRKLLDSPDDEVSGAAADTLMILSPAAHKRLASYYGAQVARQDAGDRRRDSAAALAALGPEAADTSAQLIPVLAENDNALRIEVARALGAIGPDAKAAIPALLRMVDNHQPDVRHAAVDALLRISKDGKGIAPAVMAAVENGDAENAARLAAAVQHADDAKTLGDRLKQLSDDPDARVRSAAKNAGQWLAAAVENRK